jgi:pyruvate/2-oxoacid:ferredoxin oxidoreductase beta subunit
MTVDIKSNNAPKLEHELVSRGHMACPGCGAVLGLRHVLGALGPRTILVLPASCTSVIAGRHPNNAFNVPVFHTAFETAACTAAGVRGALNARGDTETHVVAWAGDGGTFDIGLQALSGAAERNDNIIYVCYDNEAYMNTGVQRSSATPPGAWTTTTPSKQPKQGAKKDIMAIVAAHHVPYAATASIAFPEDLSEKLHRAASIGGFRFLHLLCPCPTGWRASPDLTINLARLAVTSRVFPLYEVTGGEHYKLSYDPEKPSSVADYVKAQGRFAHLDAAAIEQMQRETDHRWKRLLHLIDSNI